MLIHFNCSFIFLAMGLVALGTALFVQFVHPYDLIFNYKIVLGDGGEIYELWRKPDVNLYTKVYLFNVTNADDYMAGRDSKLKLAEVGPYVYRELLEHSNVTFNENGTLSAIPRHPLVWDEEMSEGHREDDILYMPHIALLSIAHVTAQKDFITRFGLNNLVRLTNSRPLLKMTAREFMMGHESKLMSLGHSFMPGWIYFDKLGLIDRMYDFEGDYETIYTGETNPSYSGLIDTYRGSTDLPQWEGKHCSNVQNASDGTKFKGDIGENETVLFFRKSLCRAAPLIRTGEGVKNGIEVYKFTFPEHMLDNGKHIEENKCFCREGKCLPEGLIDVTDCYYGFPIALSYPHFYKGDDILFEKVEGLTPNREQHETRLYINPKSGFPMDLSAKIQINMAIGNIDSIENTKGFSNLYLPLLWFDIKLASLAPSMETKCTLYLNALPILESAILYGSLVTGVLFVLLSAYISTFRVVLRTPRDRQNRFNFKTNIWMDDEKSSMQRNKDDIYAPCEIPLSGTESENSDEYTAKSTFIKAQSDKIREFGQKLTGKMHGIGGAKLAGDRKNSLIYPDDSLDETNDAYRSDSGDDSDRERRRDTAYLQVVDDGSEFET
ncbi:scavenger receptor class B member 1-like isoform X2 [Aricia agestis]|uniref:scavenger receptor class B member 1-like isoform X2 n=1 Tax=Aricia agestis TaxID=91739 RepID=UPI001C20A818|nr:scavenger receptor class B member 1-like isoform X2 [Aricia agestis]